MLQDQSWHWIKIGKTFQRIVAVENPVRVFFPVGRFRSTNRTCCSCWGELMLNSCPQSANISSGSHPAAPKSIFELSESIRIKPHACQFHIRKIVSNGISGLKATSAFRALRALSGTNV